MDAKQTRKPAFNPNMSTDQLLTQVATRVAALEEAGIKAVALDEIKADVGAQIATAIKSAVVNLDKLAERELAAARADVAKALETIQDFPTRWKELAELVKSHGHDLDVMENGQAENASAVAALRADAQAATVQIGMLAESVIALERRVESAAAVAHDARSAGQGVQSGAEAKVAELEKRLEDAEKRWASYVTGQSVPVAA